MNLYDLNAIELGAGILLTIITGLCIAILCRQKCDHRFFNVRTLHGDEALHRGCRHELRCSKCGKVKYG